MKYAHQCLIEDLIAADEIQQIRLTPDERQFLLLINGKKSDLSLYEEERLKNIYSKYINY